MVPRRRRTASDISIYTTTTTVVFNQSTRTTGVTTFPMTLFPSPSENYLFTSRPTKRKSIFQRRTSRHPAASAVSHHVSVVSPRSKLHGTRLLVEREVLDVYLAEGFVDGRRFPHDFSRVVQYRFRHNRHLVIAIGAANIIALSYNNTVFVCQSSSLSSSSQQRRVSDVKMTEAYIDFV